MKGCEGGAGRLKAALRAVSGAALIVALAACGGGGGGSPTAGPGPGGNALGSGGTGSTASQLRGGDFTLNSLTEGDQGSATVAALPNGGFVAAWSSTNGVRLQRFDADMQAVGGEVVVADAGNSPDVTALAGGGFMVSWSASPYMYEAHGYAQRFDAQGGRAGDLIQLASTFFKYVARVAGLADGGFVLAADSITGRYGSNFGLVTRYGADGAPSGTPLRLTSQLSEQTGAFDPNGASGTTAAQWTDGRFAAAWIASGTGVSELRVTRFDAQGNATGTDVVARGAALHEPALAVLPDGQAVVSWVSSESADGPRTLRIELLDANGASIGSQVVAANIPAASVVPRIAALGGGGFVLAWSAARYDESAMHRTVSVQRFGANGQAAGAAEQISSISVPATVTSPTGDSLDVMGGAGASFLVLYGSYTAASGWDVRGSAR